jgi:broad specificity phosphatase PhoE
MADSQTVPWNLQDAYWDKVHPGMKGRIYHEVVLFRHCESTRNADLMEGDVKSEQDVDAILTPRGEEQAKHVQFVVHGLKIPLDTTSLVVSPQRRAIDTIGKHRKWALAIPDLRERNLKKTFRIEDGCCSEVETQKEFENRVAHYIDLWSKRGTVDKRHRTIVVTHSLWIREFMRALQKADHNFSRHHFGNGSVTVIQFTEDEDGTKHAEIQMTGSVMHLPDHLRTGHHHALYY